MPWKLIQEFVSSVPSKSLMTKFISECSKPLQTPSLAQPDFQVSEVQKRRVCAKGSRARACGVLECFEVRTSGPLLNNWFL